MRVMELMANGTVGGGLLLQNGPMEMRRSLLSTLYTLPAGLVSCPMGVKVMGLEAVPSDARKNVSLVS